MNTIRRVILIIVIAAIVLGAVCIAVGFLTGADAVRIGSVLENRAAVKYNIDADALIHQWIPEVLPSIKQLFV